MRYGKSASWTLISMHMEGEEVLMVNELARAGEDYIHMLQGIHIICNYTVHYLATIYKVVM